MANETAKMFDEMLNDTESFFVPGEETEDSKPKNAPNVRGEFYGHMQNSSNREVSWTKDGKTFKALVYNYEFVVDGKNEENEYTKGDNKYSGKEYVGRTYRSNGIFRFLEPKKGDDFVSNSSGNKRYFQFCETLGIEIPRKVVKMDGQDVEVQVLPPLKGTDIDGAPAIAIIDKGKSYKNKDGQERTPYVVKFVKKWEGGVKKDADIPF
jgi:hypothetical protein